MKNQSVGKCIIENDFFISMTNLIGHVIQIKFAKGSKSEHDALYLDTGKEKFKLKKRGGNPFYDESLAIFIGKKVKLVGKSTPHFFEILSEPIVIT